MQSEPSNTTFPGEKELFLRIADGDHRAFADLFHRLVPQLHAFLGRMTHSETAAEELLQNTFLRVWINRDKLPGINTPAAWICQLAKNEAFNYIRKQLNEQKARQHMARPTSVSGDEDIAFNELKNAIAQAVAAMPAKRQQIWRMVREEGLKPAEIADKLGISIYTVKNTLADAQKNIREFLNERGLGFIAVVYLYSHVFFSTQ